MDVLHHDDATEEEEAVRVCVRIRPLVMRELQENQQIEWGYNDTCLLESTANGQKVYAYDAVFGPDANNERVYNVVAKPVVLKAVEGYNGTVFTYGQTGSGKTHSILGTDEDPGIIRLCVRDMFEYMAARPDVEYKVKVSYMEVYNEEINDLLQGGPEGRNLRITNEDAVKGAVIAGLTEEPVHTKQDLMAVLERGEANRAYGSTNMNENSSRSHTIYRLVIESRRTQQQSHNDPAVLIDGQPSFTKLTPPGGYEDLTVHAVAYLNLVDLAGSERQKSTGTSGQRLKEGANINKSLLALGAVISKLGDVAKKGKRANVFIPYRDSKLTRILKQSLGGNTLTAILCTVTPAPMHHDETVSTLKFGSLCKSIKNSVRSNEVMDDKALMHRYKLMASELKMQLDHEQEHSAALEKEKIAYLLTIDELKKEVMKSNPEILEGLRQRGITFNAAEISTALDEARERRGSEIIVPPPSVQSTEELRALREQNAKLNVQLQTIQDRLDELENDEDQRAALESYAQELEEEKEKFEKDKEALRAREQDVATRRTQLEEFEARLSGLLSTLDERESVLRQHLTSLTDQKAYWENSVFELTRRETTVKDTQTALSALEEQVRTREALVNEKSKEVQQALEALTEKEHRLKILELELKSREERNTAEAKRLVAVEAQNADRMAQLVEMERLVKNKQTTAEIRETELSARKADLQGLEAFLQERQERLAEEKTRLDRREQETKLQFDTVRAQREESEQMLASAKKVEADVESRFHHVVEKEAAVERRETVCNAREREIQRQEERLDAKAKELREWEERLIVYESKIQELSSREAAVAERERLQDEREDHFLNVQVAQIITRHKQEMSKMEQMLADQLRVITSFQKEVDRMTAELQSKLSENEELRSVLRDRDAVVARLQQEAQAYVDAHPKLKRFLRVREAVQSGATASGDIEDEDGSITTWLQQMSGDGKARGELLMQLIETRRMLKRMLQGPAANGRS